ncbi:F-box/RNI/FBD-like domain protein [Medicago truncatula]|uniref:F-box/RNI/FBD-like domain protein n=3 Tax=Medicago truncatula TaxID=3880 RepID=G7INL6_MEDTR|nr:F-box/RNI/FBD-like domain protein [Medicago truncatula]
MSMAVDRIGSLPDEILIHILSFVPTKQAFVTSILSKRWTHLWCFVPNLDFSDTKLKNGEDSSRFSNFVNTVFHSQDCFGSHAINSFILDIDHFFSGLLPCGTYYINGWVDILVERKVQYLNLYLHAPVNWEETIPPTLPTAIFTSTTLVVLKLCWFFMGVDFPFPFTFPSLKTLHLKDFYFHQQSDFFMLLDGCPVLQDLQLSNINRGHFDFASLLYLSSSRLKNLNRADIIDCHCIFPMKSLSNLEFLRIQLLEYDQPNDFPTFHNLIHLVINYDGDIVVQVLHHCPKLQNLELYRKLQGCNWEDEFIEEDDQENWVDSEFVPPCFSLNLTTCTIRDFAFAGLQHCHIMLAKFILKNARVLRTMTILCNKKQSKVERLLSSCPRASTTCQLSIY